MANVEAQGGSSDAVSQHVQEPMPLQRALPAALLGCAACGIFDHFYRVRCGAPWATTGHWHYRDSNECGQALNDAMDVIAIVHHAIRD